MPQQDTTMYVIPGTDAHREITSLTIRVTSGTDALHEDLVLLTRYDDVSILRVKKLDVAASVYIQRGFQSLLLTGKYGVGDGDFPPFQTSSDTFLSPYTRTYTDKSILPLHNIQSSPEYSRFRCDEKVKRQKYEHSTALPELRSLEEEKAEKSYREVAYRRRHTLSEKTRSLQKLLPVDRKMEIATVYEESYNYIEFLKAQIFALESMPVSSCTSASNFRSENPRCSYDGGLGELNRQQLLEALNHHLLNSLNMTYHSLPLSLNIHAGSHVKFFNT